MDISSVGMRARQCLSGVIGNLSMAALVLAVCAFDGDRAVARNLEMQTLNWDDAFERSARGTLITEEGQQIAPMVGPDSERAMLQAIARYEIFVRRGGWPTIPGGHTLVVGAKDRRVQLLAHRLMIGGDLVPPPGFDDTLYDATIMEAVKQFQRRHGLRQTGKVDEKTRIALNVPALKRLKTLKKNLPRMREAAKGLRDRYVVVNIPAAELETVQDGYLFSRHVTVVGKVDRPTPEVSSHVTEVNFNPYWHAPISIAEKDIIPQLQRGTSYLRKINLKVFEGSYYGKEVDPKTVDWSTASARKYFFRQEPGESNAMATVRIKFPNKHDVYLHDTPGKGLFMTAVRYDSSGCIRVDQVQTFVEWLLRGERGGWNMERIDEVAESKERIDINLARPVPVRVAYLTAWTTADGDVHFRDDIYGYDDPEAVRVARKAEAEEQPAAKTERRKHRRVKGKYPLPKPNPQRVKRRKDTGRFTSTFGDSVFEEVR